MSESRRTPDIIHTIIAFLSLVLTFALTYFKIDFATVGYLLQKFKESLYFPVVFDILHILIVFLSVIFFAYLISKVTKIFDSKFETVLFRRKIDRDAERQSESQLGFLKKIKNFLVAWVGYTVISLIVVQSLFYSFGTSVGSVDFAGRNIPLHVLFSFSLIIAIHFLVEYQKDTSLAKNLFYNLLFAFLTLFIYSVVLNPSILIDETSKYGVDILASAFILAFFKDRFMDMYCKGREIKRIAKSSINRGLSS